MDKQLALTITTWVLIVICTLVIVSYILTPSLFGYNRIECAFTTQSGGRQYCQVLIDGEKPIIYTRS